MFSLLAIGMLTVALVRRIVLSVGVMLALLMLTAVAPCLACSLPAQTGPAHGSCCHHGGCDKPANAPVPKGCANPDLGIAAIEKSTVQTTPAAAPTTTLALVSQPAPVIAIRQRVLPPLELYSTPDLCVLHSVFNV